MNLSNTDKELAAIVVNCCSLCVYFLRNGRHFEAGRQIQRASMVAWKIQDADYYVRANRLVSGIDCATYELGIWK